MEHIPNCFYRISIKALITDDQNRFMLTREKQGTWELPGGGLDFGENYEEGLQREIAEEMRLTVTSIEKRPSYFFTWQEKNGIWKSNVVFKTTLENLNFTPTDECLEIRFFTPEEALRENLCLNIPVFANLFAQAQI